MTSAAFPQPPQQKTEDQLACRGSLFIRRQGVKIQAPLTRQHLCGVVRVHRLVEPDRYGVLPLQFKPGFAESLGSESLRKPTSWPMPSAQKKFAYWQQQLLSAANGPASRRCQLGLMPIVSAVTPRADLVHGRPGCTRVRRWPGSQAVSKEPSR